jgi:hypothetical protein
MRFKVTVVQQFTIGEIEAESFDRAHEEGLARWNCMSTEERRKALHRDGVTTLDVELIQ